MKVGLHREYIIYMVWADGLCLGFYQYVYYIYLFSFGEENDLLKHKTCLKNDRETM